MKLIDILNERKYQTDKHTDHHYIQEFYEIEFEHLRDKELNILEIGVWRGDSLKLWHDYFINSNIYGADHFIRVGEDRVRTELSSFGRIKQLLNIDSTEKKLYFDVQMDIIIDDGAHNPDAQIQTYENTKHLLKDGGIYIIEDFQKPHSSSTKKVKDAIPEIELIPIQYKNEWIGVIKK